MANAQHQREDPNHRTVFVISDDEMDDEFEPSQVEESDDPSQERCKYFSQGPADVADFNKQSRPDLSQ